MKRRIGPLAAGTVALLALVSVPPATAQEVTATGDLLRSAIELEELPDRSETPLPLAFGREPQDVDINSTISIRVSPELLTGTRAERAGLAARVSPRSADLLDVSAQLRRSVDALAREVEDAVEMGRMIAAGRRDSAAFRSLAEPGPLREREITGSIEPYWESLEAATERSLRRRATDGRKRAEAEVREGRYGAARVLAQEVEWMVDELNEARRRVSEQPPEMALFLSAVHHGREQQVELGLPGYNLIEVGAPVRFDKVNLVPSAEQLEEIRRLRLEAAALAEALQPVLDGSRNLEDVLEDLLENQDFGIGQLRAAFDAVLADVRALRGVDWRAVARDLESQLEEALAAAGDDVRQDLEALGATLDDLLADLEDFDTDLQQVLDALDDVSFSLPDLTAVGGNPVEALLRLLTAADRVGSLAQAVRDLFGELRRGIPDWVGEVRGLVEAASAFGDRLQDLPDDLRPDFEELLDAIPDPRLSALAEGLGRLRDAVRAFISNLRGLGEVGDLLAVAAALRDLEPPATSFAVPAARAGDTWLDVQTLNPRREGDVVSIRAWLYRMEPSAGDPQVLVQRELLDRVSQQLRILRFGWYTAPSVGLTYLSSFDPIPDGDAAAAGGTDGGAVTALPERTESFVPQVSWMFRHRSWNRDRQRGDLARYRPRWHDRVGLGFHTVALDLDNDNQLEVGLGVTLSLFDDYLQLGVGVDLSLEEEPYFFLGTRLFELARGLGIRSVPGAAGTGGF